MYAGSVEGLHAEDVAVGSVVGEDAGVGDADDDLISVKQLSATDAARRTSVIRWRASLSGASAGSSASSLINSGSSPAIASRSARVSR